ncbi:MAG: TetR family transcriptional regulator C-terminal domain-containing protein [Pseudomonadota bacterium]
MSKPTNRDKILQEGAKVVHRFGFGGASVRDIIQAAGVPQGSFTNHFHSKEAFGLELLDLYFLQVHALLQTTLQEDALPPLARLRGFMAANLRRMEDGGIENGCLLSNFCGETVAHSERIRLRLLDIFAELRAALAYCLTAAVQAGELPATLECEAMTDFILAGLQGSTMQAKVQRDAAPLRRFEHMLFEVMLPRPGARAMAQAARRERSAA